MTVRFVWNPARVERMTVLVVPPEPPPGSDVPSWSGAKPPTAYEAGRELRGRVLEANAAAGTLTVEVDGRRETFLADPRDLRTLRKDARVVIVTGEDGRVASVRQER
jgi:hypothetical protein